MQSCKKVKNRIRSISNTRQITDVMKMISSVKLHRAQNAVQANRMYSSCFNDLILRVAVCLKEHPFFAGNSAAAFRGTLLITSDTGLAGALNYRLFQAVRDEFGAPKEGLRFWVIGKKGNDWLRKAGFSVEGEPMAVSDVPTYEEARKVSGVLRAAYLGGRFRQISLVYQSFLSGGKQKPACRTLLPLEAPEKKPEAETEYRFEDGATDFAAEALPLFFDSLVYQALLEAKASEHISRMLAMDLSGKNSEKLEAALRLEYNSARQAEITREISEIISGKNALAVHKEAE